MREAPGIHPRRSKSMKRMLMTTAAAMFAGTMAFGAITSDSVITDLQSQGYTRVEVKVGPTQMKVEAIKGTSKVEVIYDIATGTVLKRETGTVGAFENTTPGVQVRDRDRDFVRVSGSDDSSDDDSNDDHGGDGNDDGPDHDSNDDDDDDSSGSGGNSGSGGSGGSGSSDD
jgi:uncharacterized membrane protein YgcG